LLQLLQEAEAHSRLLPGTAEALTSASSQLNPFLTLVRQLALALNIPRFDPDLHRFWVGRPKAFAWALLADAIADEVRTVSPYRMWPVVADVLRPLLVIAGLCDTSEHLRRLVSHWKWTINERIKKGCTDETWEQDKEILRQQARSAQHPL